MSVVDDIKSLVGLLKKVSDLEVRNELNAKLTEMTANLLDTQGRLGELQDENAKLRAGLRAERETKQLHEGLRLLRDVYWEEEPDSVNGPAHCPACLDTRGKRVPLTHIQRVHAHAVCPSCQVTFVDTFDRGPEAPSGSTIPATEGPKTGPLVAWAKTHRTQRAGRSCMVGGRGVPLMMGRRSRANTGDGLEVSSDSCPSLGPALRGAGRSSIPCAGGLDSGASGSGESPPTAVCGGRGRFPR